MTDQANLRERRVPVGPDGVLPEDVFPRAFGSYLLLKVFARGGMGEVYLARQISTGGLDRYCVVKKLRKELTRDREYVTRFIDEARVVVHLDHPNICRTFDVGRVGEEYYLAMEYVSGCDVRMVQDKARNDGVPLSADAVLPLMSELLEALDHAHERRDQKGELLRLVHRDISPQNVMISYDGEVKLIDFGLASSKLKIEKTQPNVVMGKMAYMSPEQARGDAIDHRADLFAVGVMTYELLANERFYEGMGTHEIWQVVGRGGFAPRRWRELDPALQAIIGRALHPDHNHRFETCGEFRDALNAYLADHYPQAGRGTVRAVVEDMFFEEIVVERQILAGFANTSITDLRDDIEKSRSQSVSLIDGAPVDDGSTSLEGAGQEASGARVQARDGVLVAEPGDGKTPPTGTHSDSFRVRSNEGIAPALVPDRGPAKIHDERTVLHEHTEFVPRAQGPRPPDREEGTQIIRPTLEFATPVATTQQTKLRLVGIAAAVAIVVLLGAIGAIVLQRQPASATTVAGQPASSDVVAPSPSSDTPPDEAAPETAEGTEAAPPTEDGNDDQNDDDEVIEENSDDGNDAMRPRRRGRNRSRTVDRRPTKLAVKTPPVVTKPKDPEPTSRKDDTAAAEAEQARLKRLANDAAKKARADDNATKQAEARAILEEKGYKYTEMYPLSVKFNMANGDVFLAKAKRTPKLQASLKNLKQKCGSRRPQCFQDVSSMMVLYAQKQMDKAELIRFAKKLEICHSTCSEG